MPLNPELEAAGLIVVIASVSFLIGALSEANFDTAGMRPQTAESRAFRSECARDEFARLLGSECREGILVSYLKLR